MSPLADYSSLEKEIKDAPELKVLEKGTEVKARIISVRTGMVEKEDSEYYGVNYFSVVFDTPDEPLVKEFNDFFWDLAEAKGQLSEKNFNKALRHFKTFAEAFGIDYSRPFSIEDDLPGLTGWLIVGVKKSDEYGDQNTVQKYLAPQGSSQG